MKSSTPRQGRIAGWLKLHGATVTDLAAHLDVTASHTSRLCNSDTVPTATLAKMQSFTAPSGERIPRELLPAGQDKKRGPEKGWLDRLREQAASGQAARA